jgi:hypothetical protein
MIALVVLMELALCLGSNCWYWAFDKKICRSAYCGYDLSHFPAGTSQSLMVLSRLPEASVRPFGLKTTALMLPR